MERIRAEVQAQHEMLEPLTYETLEDEIKGLQEDCLNWDHGHEMTFSEVALEK